MTDTVMTGTGGFHVTSLTDLNDQFEELQNGTGGIELHPGITAYPVLWSNGSVKEAFVCFDAGARYPVPDRHDTSAELLVVIDGDLDCDANGTCPPGTLIYGPRGSSHYPGTRYGCVVHVFYPDL
ncbi:cupin domain-containing protein [Streptomyces sp. NPDC050428]|uniref:cupin domain-containing protein n=1 Tax=Streptomyces sp. NPDC050428 TaxID=3155757 RepID=UPI00341AF123